VHASSVVLLNLSVVFKMQTAQLFGVDPTNSQSLKLAMFYGAETSNDMNRFLALKSGI
jgi:hypothetical protein